MPGSSPSKRVRRGRRCVGVGVRYGGSPPPASPPPAPSSRSPSDSVRRRKPSRRPLPRCVKRLTLRGRRTGFRPASTCTCVPTTPLSPSGRCLSIPSDVEGPSIECCEALVPHVRELWLGDSAGDARLRERRAGELQFVSEEERERWIELGRPKLDAKTPFSGILDGLPPRSWYEGPLDLPSDANAIYEEFERDSELDHTGPGAPEDVDVSGSMFLHFSDVLREARATPEQRAAAYEALARVPGLSLVGDVTDRLGRRGVAIALDVVDNEPSGFLYRYVLVFDPPPA